MTKIDDLPENQLVTLINNLIEIRDSVKDRQLIGKRAYQLERVSTADTYDIVELMDTEYRNFLLTFTPDNSRIGQGVAYKLFIIQDHDDPQANVEWLRQPFSEGSNSQTWFIALHNFTREPGSPSPLTFTMRAKFFVVASDTGTLAVQPL